MNASYTISAENHSGFRVRESSRAGRTLNTLATLLLALGMLLLSLGAQAQTIHRITAPGKFYVDDKQGAGIVYNYAVYAISNSTGTNISSAYVAMTNMVATNRITLAANDSGVRALGALAPGQTKLAAFYLKGPSFTGNSDSLYNVTNENHTIRVLNGPPGVGATLVSSNYSYTDIIFVIEALANKVTIITNLNPQAVLGSDVDLVIGGETGTIGGNNSVSFSPGVLGSWRPDAYELVGCVVRFVENGNFTNQMYFDPTISGFTNYTGQIYTNTFRFRAVKVTGTNLPVSPFAFVDSGSGTKHTAVSTLTGGGGSNLIYSATNAVTIVSQAVAPASLLAPGGTVTYSVTFTNHAFNTPLDLNEIRNTLAGFPGNVTYIPGSATWNSAPLADPGISGQELRWALPLTVNPQAVVTLTFQATAPLPAGQYTNSVIAILGNEQIDTTIDTTDNSPSLSVFTVIPVADVALLKSAPASVYSSSNFDYTITITNLGPSPATSLSVTDSLPAAVTFVSATPAATFNGTQVIWTNLGPIAAGATSSLTITVTPPSVIANMTNTASGGSPVLDPDSTNNVAPPVVTSVTPSTDLALQKIAPPVIASGVNFNYTLVVSNRGPSLASNVTVSDALAPNLTFVSASHGGTFGSGTVTWSSLGNLAANSSLALTLTVTAPLSGSTTNSASLSSPTHDPVSTNNTTPPIVSVVGNVPPNTVNDTASTLRNVPVTVPVLANDSDDNGDPLTLIGVTQTNGTASVVGASVQYSPATNFVGSVVLTYTVIDGQGGTNTGLLTISVTNRPPVALDDTANTTNGVPQVLSPLVNDADPDGDTLTITNVIATTGLVTINPGATNLTFTPTNKSVAVITYTISDGYGGSATATITATAANLIPVPGSLTLTIPEDTATNLVLTATDDDTNLVFAILSGPANGSLGTLNTNTGAVTYSPTNNYNGPDSLTFTVFDGSLYATGTVSITVTPLNDPPVINDDNIVVTEDSTNTIPVLVNDSDPDGNPLTIVSVSTNGGIATIVGTNVVYTPSPNFSGTNVLTYCITDGFATNCATITVVVLPVNDAPLANNQSVTIPEDTSTNLVLTASDVDNTNLTFAIVSGPASGSLGTLNTNTGAVMYSPNTNYAGSDSFTFTVFDGSLYATGTVSITVTPINDAPVANNQGVTMSEDSSTNLVLTASDVDSTNLTFSIITNPSNGGLSVLNTNTGAVTYSPNSNYVGGDSFTFRVFDGSLYATGTVSIIVTPINDAPLAFSQSVTNLEDTALPITLLGSDVDGPVTNFVLAALPVHGSLSGSGANLTYTPTNNYNGPDSFTFTVNDGSLTSAVATVSITVLLVNDVPVANNDGYGTFKNVPLNVSAPGVLANDSDVEGALTASLATNVTHGTLLLNGDGGFTYTPSNNYVGPDSFTYRASDGTTNSLAIVSLTISATNVAPVAVSDSYSVNEDEVLAVPVSGVLTNDTDADADTLTATVVATTTNGVLLLNANGAFTYTPSANVSGVDHFTYLAHDAFTNSAVTTVTVTINATNDAPVATNLSVTINEDTSTNLVVTGSDVDSTNLTFSIVSTPSNGSLGTLNTNTGAVMYSPNTNYAGSDSFTFTVFDGSLYATGTVSITVLPVNDAPVAVADSFTAQQNTPTFFIPAGVLGNDTDVENNALTAVLVTSPAHGSLGLNSDGSFIYTSTNGFTGTDTFTYAANDGTNSSAPATVSILVTPLADLALFMAGPTSVTPGQSLTYTITVTNFGPSAASNVLVFDVLPTNIVFVSASAGGVHSNNLVVWPVLQSLPKNASTNLTLTVMAPTNGSLINFAYVIAATPDPDLSNNDGSAAFSRVTTFVAPVAFGVRQGTNVFNPQTGLYEQLVGVTNLSGSTVAAFQVLVGDFASTNGTPRTNVWLWNATGTNFDGRRYVQYNLPLDPGSNATVRLEFYNPTRVPFTNSIEIVATLPTPAVTNLSGGVVIDRAFTDLRIAGEPRFVIEWTSVIGASYTVIYSDDNMATWTAATPSVTAGATRVQWYDDGPPKTASKPLSGGSRFYRVILNP